MFLYCVYRPVFFVASLKIANENNFICRKRKKFCLTLFGGDWQSTRYFLNYFLMKIHHHCFANSQLSSGRLPIQLATKPVLFLKTTKIKLRHRNHKNSRSKQNLYCNYIVERCKSYKCLLLSL